MADSAVRQPAGSASDQSLGDLVSLAVKDVTQLLRFEIDLAKVELKADIRRAGFAAALLGIAAFVACLVLMLVSFSFAYGLVALGIYTWASFLIVAGTYVLLAALAVFIAVLKFRGLSGLRKTRQTVQDDLVADPARRQDPGGQHLSCSGVIRCLRGATSRSISTAPGRTGRSAPTGPAFTSPRAATGRWSCCCTGSRSSGGPGASS